MNITDFFRRRPASELTTADTPYGRFDLAKKADARRVKAVIAEVQRQAESLTRQEIDSWRSGWQQALDVENPSRLRLYNVYRDVEVDGEVCLVPVRPVPGHTSLRGAPRLRQGTQLQDHVR